MIKSIFFSRFLTKEGPKVLYQVPDGSIVPSTTCSQLPIIDFESVSSFVIPRQRFCDRLVSISTNHYRILGHPVCIESPKYDRNEFIFNLSIVLEEDEDHSSYITVVRKLAVLFRNLEEQGEFLSRDLEERQAGRSRGKVYALCEIILEDLNNYCECMIPIDESNTINIKLFPRFPPPPPVKAWHVPLSTVRLESLMDENWDLTMQRIIPHVDGIKSVRQIAERADADLNLVKKCIEHLLYYGCLLMLDIFQFGAIYAPTAEISTLIEDKTMQQECASYISMLGLSIPVSFCLSSRDPSPTPSPKSSCSVNLIHPMMHPSRAGDNHVSSHLPVHLPPPRSDAQIVVHRAPRIPLWDRHSTFHHLRRHQGLPVPDP